MSGPPPGWEMTTIGEVAHTSLGKMLDRKKATGTHPTPYLRNINVRWGHFDLTDVASMDIRPEELDRVLARPGDVIVCEGGEPGRAAVWRGPGAIALQKALHRVRPRAVLLPDYLALLLRHLSDSRLLEPFFTGTTIKHLPQEKLRHVPIPLPPVGEQEGIVAAIDEHLYRLDAAISGIRGTEVRARQCERGILSHVQEEGDVTVLDDLLVDIQAGRSFQTPGGPAASDQWGVIKVSAMTWGHFRDQENKGVPPGYPIDERFEIKTGDLLLSRANTSEYVGAAVLVGECRPHLLLSDKSMRLVPRPGVDRAWLRYSLASPRLRAQMSLAASGTSDSMRNISQAKVRALLIRVPSRDRQLVLARWVESGLAVLERLMDASDVVIRRAQVLRGSILTAAFRGRLVGQGTDNEPGSSLSARISGGHGSEPNGPELPAS